MNPKRIECIGDLSKLSPKSQKKTSSDRLPNRMSEDATGEVFLLDFHKSKSVKEYMKTLYH